MLAPRPTPYATMAPILTLPGLGVFRRLETGARGGGTICPPLVQVGLIRVGLLAKALNYT